jgi:ribonuclease-3
MATNMCQENWLIFLQKIDYQFNNPELLQEAITHPSLSRELKTKFNYERLEFLGDKILSLVIAEFLIEKYKKENEGDLSKRQAHLVSGETLSLIAAQIGVEEVLKLSKGENLIGGKNNKRNLENALEAIIGAIYLDSNYDQAKKFILKFWSQLLEAENSPPKDPVSYLQELVQEKSRELPSYEIIRFGGSEHSPLFTASVKISFLNLIFSATGKSKKEAQKNVAKIALKEIRNSFI